MTSGPRPDDAYWRADIEFHLSAPDSTFAITTDIPGLMEVSEDGEVVYWRLDAPLEPRTAYTVHFAYRPMDPPDPSV